MQRASLRWDPLPLDAPELTPETDTQDLCTAAVEKRIRDEQTWQLQKTLQDLIFRFQDWLWNAEAMAASPDSSQVSYANSKKELQRFEALQRQVSDKLLPLEALNRLYHQLVRRGGVCPQLRSRVQDVNQRWDALKTWAAAVYKRLKHFVNQWEEFESERETLRLWLMELDLRLTNVEHFSGGTSLEKMIQLQAFQEDVQANAERVDRLLVHGESLIQKSHPEDAETLEEELQDLSCFCQEVFRRVFRFRRRLVSMSLVFEDEWLSDRDSDLASDCFSEDSLQLGNGDSGQPLPPVGPLCQSTPQKAPQHHKRSGLTVGGTMDLEWDPSVDVGGSTSHDEEDSSYYSAITGVGHSEEPRRRHRSSLRVSSSLPLRCGSEEDFTAQSGFGEEWEQLDCAVAKQKQKMCRFGKSFSQEEPEGCQQPQSQTLQKGSGRPLTEPTGFDPKRIESWLGQSCQEERRMRAETPEQGAGICTRTPLPAMGKYAVQSATGRQAKRQKPQQRAKKKARPTLISSPGLVSNGQLGEQPQEVSKEKRLESQPAEIAITVEKGYDPPPRPRLDTPIRSLPLPKILPLWNRPTVLFLLALLLLLLLLAGPSSLSEPPCLQANGYARSFHLMLKHSGRPPT